MLQPSVLRRDLLQRSPWRIANRTVPGKSTINLFVGFDPGSRFFVVWAPSGFSVVVQTSQTLIWLSLLISDVRMTSNKKVGALRVVASEVRPSGGSLRQTSDGQRTVWACYHSLN